MPLFVYQAIDKSSQLVNGKLEAEQEFSAIAKLHTLGYTILDMEEKNKSNLRNVFATQSKVKIGELSFFSRQLATMLLAGITLTRCLDTLSKQTEHPVLQRTLREVSLSVEGGMSMSEALSVHPGIFPAMYIDMIKAGEISGKIGIMLNRLSEQMDREKNLRDNIHSATMYPIIVMIFALCVVLVMMYFVVPIFIEFFPENITLPMPTRVVMSISYFLRDHFYLFIVALFLVILYLRLYLSSPGGRQTQEKLTFKIPVFGGLLKKATVARFARTLSTLLEGGIPVLQALEVAGPASGSKQVADAIKQVSMQIIDGQGIAEPLNMSRLFPPMLVNMVAVGEETGQLPMLLGQVAEFYEAEVSSMTKGLTTLIEPVLLIFIGCIVGAILISIYLPVFTVVTTMGG